jgi:TonB family protein
MKSKRLKWTALLLLFVIGEASASGNIPSEPCKSSTATVIPEGSAEDDICSNPDVRPKYNAENAIDFLVDFLRKNLHYPEEAVKKGLQGTVIVQMVVERDGTPTNFKVVKEVHPLLDNEALRVAKLLPKFIPAKKDEKPVRCIFNISIPYRL